MAVVAVSSRLPFRAMFFSGGGWSEGGRKMVRGWEEDGRWKVVSINELKIVKIGVDFYWKRIKKQLFLVMWDKSVNFAI
ncbi:MAG: hypothetical protein IJ634_04455 [Bacteroidales bacterium]|nr:hypothetical protein [Bacteroidales bacterium]